MGIQTSTINSGPVAGFKNKIINGNFDYWQRHTVAGSSTWVAPISNFFGADRWLHNCNGTGGAGALTRQSFTVGQSEVPNNPAYFLRLNVTTAPSGQTAGNNYVEQRIEDVTTLATQQVTVSFWARGSGTLPGIYLCQTFGTGGSAQVCQTLVTNLALSGGTTGAWTKYVYTATLPSVSGKTIGTDHYVNLTWQLPINTTYQIDLAQVQVEQGPVATQFEMRPQAVEEMLCLRYCMAYLIGTDRTLGPYPNLYSNYAAAGSNFQLLMTHGPMYKTGTGTRTGTWSVSNCGQPSIIPQNEAATLVQAVASTSNAAQTVPSASNTGYLVTAEIV